MATPAHPLRPNLATGDPPGRASTTNAPDLRLSYASDAPVQEAQLDQLRRAHRMGRPLRRASTIATVSGWSTIAFGLVAAPFALHSMMTLALSLALLALGFNELCARNALRRLELNAPARLAYSQLALGGTLIAYAVLQIIDLGPVTLAASPLDASLIQGGNVDQASLESISNALSALVCVALIVGTLLTQGSTALYYVTRGRRLRAFVGANPPWVMDVMNALRTL